MPAIYLIRHGQASFGADDYDCLSKLGEQQAQKAGKYLTEIIPDFDTIIRGDMLRHKQTADLALPSATVQIDANWNEYDHQNILGKLDPRLATAAGIKQYLTDFTQPNKKLNELIKQAFTRWIAGKHDDDYQESWPVYKKRIHQALNNTLENHKNSKHIAVFTSGGPIALVAQHLLKIPAENLMQLNWSLVNCGVTKLITTSQGLMLSSLNEHSIFDGKNKHLLSYV